ncbi:hypothetical protein O7634_18345 [Micromonospora sp. WMMD1120]|uniref:hypothetical protein n=1 Tax=Micromonospora sp. WMMD1120 TaxID=3016106 RepID=UPI002415A0A3|nr:hypothetical protein [Micromonospora sp. WMMD1120]MDG4808709.1 hypothetical protein [Micromonospora sp. WMMD1120]
MSVLLFLIGQRVSPAAYRLAALSGALVAGCAGLLGDYRVLTVQLTTQVVFGTLMSKPKPKPKP